MNHLQADRRADAPGSVQVSGGGTRRLSIRVMHACVRRGNMP